MSAAVSRRVALAAAGILFATAVVVATARPAGAQAPGAPTPAPEATSAPPTEAPAGGTGPGADPAVPLEDPVPVAYAPPVDAPVVEAFRAPASPYGAGHRGLTYGTEQSAAVAAAAPGIVVFAGPVAGRSWVTILHADGVRTSYGPLQTIAVAAGAVVDRGATVGTTSGRLVFTARIGDAYVDPALLLGAAGPGTVHLVRDLSELPTYASSSFGLGDLVAPVGAALGATRDRVTEQLVALEGVTPPPILFGSLAALARWRASGGKCTPESTAVPPATERRVAVFVGGLGSSSADAAIDDLDTATLGYADGDVIRFSYRGGRVPSTARVSDELSGLGVSTYEPADTTGDVTTVAHGLARLLASTAAALPTDVAVDVYAHSQGGLVVRLALDELAARDPATLARIRLVGLLGTPNQGAELAALVGAITRDPLRAAAFDATAGVTGVGVESGDPALAELAPGSAVLQRLAAAGSPAGPSYVTVAAQRDPVVPSPDVALAGATNVVVPVAGLDAHSRLPGSAAVTRELALARAGLAPSCESAPDAVLDAVWGDLLRNGEQFVAATRGP